MGFQSFKGKAKKRTYYSVAYVLLYVLNFIHPEFNEIKHLGIYNPGLNIVYGIDVNKISDDVIF